MKNLAGLFFAAFLSLFATSALAQCNTASGFIQTEGPIPLGNILALGPDCNHVKDGGVLPVTGFIYTSQCGITFDGVTDDTVAWNNCISTAASSRTIIAPCGVSIINTGNVTINIFTNTIIVGQGPYCTVLRSAGTTADMIKVVGSPISGCEISNMTIDQKGGVVRTAGAGINASNNNINGCNFNHLIINGAFDGLVLGPANYAFTSYLQIFNSKRYGLLFQNGPGASGGVSLQWKLDHLLFQGNVSDAIHVQATSGPTGPLSFENWNSVYTFNNGGYGVNVQCVVTLTCFGIRISDSFFGNDGLGEINISSWNGGHTIDHTYFEQSVLGACVIIDNTNIDAEVSSSWFLQCAGFAIDSAPTVNFSSNGNKFQANNAAAGSGTIRAADCANGKLLYAPNNFRISGTGPEVNCTSGLLKTFVFALGDTATIGSWAIAAAPFAVVVFNNTMTLGSVAGATLTFQGTDIYVGRNTSDVLVNKTIDTNGPNTIKVTGVDIAAGGVPYTPVVSCGGGAPAAQTAIGVVKTIGKIVLFSAQVTLFTIGSCTSFMKISLPFNSNTFFYATAVFDSTTGATGSGAIAGNIDAATVHVFSATGAFPTGFVPTVSGWYLIP